MKNVPWVSLKKLHRNYFLISSSGGVAIYAPGFTQPRAARIWGFLNFLRKIVFCCKIFVSKKKVNFEKWRFCMRWNSWSDTIETYTIWAPAHVSGDFSDIIIDNTHGLDMLVSLWNHQNPNFAQIFWFWGAQMTYNHRSHHGASLCNESKIRKSSILSSESTLELSVRVPAS